MQNIYEILSKLPHRYPFLLVDRVLDIDVEHKTIHAVKNVTVNEPCFTGHFPGRPIFPGVLLLEALAQSCALLSFKTENIALDDESVFYFVGVDGARFKRPVIPGDQVLLTSVMDRARGGIYKFNCKASVQDDTVAEAQIMCTMRKVV